MPCSIAVAAGATRARVPCDANANVSSSATRERVVVPKRAAVVRGASAREDVRVACGIPAPRRAARAAAAAALSLTLALASPDASLAAKEPSATPSDPSFGNSLLERRRVEETAARANLDSVYAELKEEEAKLKALRFEREAERVREINEIRQLEEQKARAQVANGNTLCVTPFGVDVVGITQTVALVGAIGAGLTSNARKAEIAELNEKLRAVNSTLRAQIRQPAPAANASGVYQDGGVAVNRATIADDGLPSVTSGGPMDSMDLEEEAAAAARAAAEASGAVTDQRDPAESATDAELKRALRDGRALLKEETEPAFKRSLELFEKALTLARMVGDTTQTRRATRGLAASKRGLGDGKGAIKNLKEVLEMRPLVGDAAGDTDALGAIADIYTELGDLENAGKYYDLYLDALNNEMMS
jgi:tetratricopeptide (TPR) repeat protein